MSCESCVKDVSTSLYALRGITKVDADLESQLISVEGTVAPSSIVKAIQGTGRDAILRGSGVADSRSRSRKRRNILHPARLTTHAGAAVCILETHSTSVSNYVRGLVRLVQVAPSLTLIDLTVRGLSPGRYHASIREGGDITQGPESVGKIWEWGMWQRQAQQDNKPIRGVLGTVEVSKSGVGAVFLDTPVQVWEIIGRSIVVSNRDSAYGGSGKNGFDKQDPDTLVGVIARSAGVWDNDKTVCSCSGKTVWEERKEQSDRGML